MSTRVLHLVNHCRLGHGNVHAAVDLACIQATRGDQVYYASEGGELHDLLVREGVHFRHLTQKSKNPFVLVKTLMRLVGIVRLHRIDIVHAHMMSGALLGYLITRITRAHLVTTVHNSFDSHSTIMRLGDRIVSVSKAEQIALASRGFPASRLTTIVNGPLWGARARYINTDVKLDLPRPSLTTVCGLHSRKGVNYLIEAFRTVQHTVECHLNIVGDGPDRMHLESLAAATGFQDRIRFHGSLNDPTQVLRETDIFVLASLAEPLGLVNIEARSAGCAIVATDVGGVPEALDHGKAGVLVPPGDALTIANAIVRLLTNPAELQNKKMHARMGLQKFSVERLYDEYNRVYETLLERPKRPLFTSKSST